MEEPRPVERPVARLNHAPARIRRWVLLHSRSGAAGSETPFGRSQVSTARQLIRCPSTVTKCRSVIPATGENGTFRGVGEPRKLVGRGTQTRGIGDVVIVELSSLCRVARVGGR
jgi:hypothetical protein